MTHAIIVDPGDLSTAAEERALDYVQTEFRQQRLAAEERAAHARWLLAYLSTAANERAAAIRALRAAGIDHFWLDSSTTPDGVASAIRRARQEIGVARYMLPEHADATPLNRAREALNAFVAILEQEPTEVG